MISVRERRSNDVRPSVSVVVISLKNTETVQERQRKAAKNNKKPAGSAGRSNDHCAFLFARNALAFAFIFARFLRCLRVATIFFLFTVTPVVVVYGSLQL